MTSRLRAQPMIVEFPTIPLILNVGKWRTGLARPKGAPASPPEFSSITPAGIKFRNGRSGDFDRPTRATPRKSPDVFLLI
jgi:hypothetical protein